MLAEARSVVNRSGAHSPVQQGLQQLDGPINIVTEIELVGVMT